MQPFKCLCSLPLPCSLCPTPCPLPPNSLLIDGRVYHLVVPDLGVQPFKCLCSLPLPCSLFPPHPTPCTPSPSPCAPLSISLLIDGRVCDLVVPDLGVQPFKRPVFLHVLHHTFFQVLSFHLLMTSCKQYLGDKPTLLGLFRQECCDYTFGIRVFLATRHRSQENAFQ